MDPSSSSSLSSSTRISATSKPSARRRQSPQSTSTTPKPTQNAVASSSRQTHSIQPCPQDQIPQFPPPDVMLHRDDAGSKVFLAIARSLLSVDNRATTVKDLADLAVQNGLGCQNSSAATQAITTYIRTHHDRCDADHDQPLLLSHNLSGTDADDDLIPALYSLQGGNPRKVSPSRRTNFRKNTAVWYLSRATGAPCPFARAGIRLCEYANLGGEEVDEGHKKKRRSKLVEEAVALGQKRKRPHRSCVARDSSDEEASETDLDTRPQKKLTLRIRLNCPSLSANRLSEERNQRMSDSDDDSSSDESVVEMESCVDHEEEEEAPRQSSPEKEEEEEPWRLPPYPRRSIAIPCYTPSFDGPYPVPTDFTDPYRRSPSVARSVGSLPPDSEDEDDYHISMTKTDFFSEDSTGESDLESEDADTLFESPGPRSPSAPLIPPQAQVTVKEEPRDLQGMLDAWDDIDSGFVDPRISVVTESAPLKLKTESSDLWDWDAGDQWTESPHIKQEDLTFDSLFQDSSLLSSPSPPTSSSASDVSPLQQGIGLKDEEWNDADTRFGTIRPRSKTEPAFPSSQTPPSAGPSSLSVPPPSPAPQSDSLTASNSELTTTTQPYSTSSTNLTIASLIQTVGSLCSSGISPSSLVLTPTTPDVVLVRTCEPCNPPVTATQIEDISVYQMVLGNFHFLRRIDTDFVNLTPIVNYLQSPFPVLSTVPNATVITKGSAAVVGIWVPLPVAQVYLKDHPAKEGEFDVFLSDELYARFPTALQDFHRSNAPGRMLNQFGRHFGSTLQVSQAQQHQQQVMSIVSAAEMLARQHQTSLPPVISISPSTSDAYALSASMAERQQHDEMDVPLSATEREIFDLCVFTDWDRDSSATLPPAVVAAEKMEEEEELESTGDDGDVSDSSSLTSLESISLPKKAAQPPTPPQASTSSTGPTAMEIVDEPRRAAEEANRPLRRSKRVADLAASHQQPGSGSAASGGRARTRGGRGSRNSIS